MLHLNKFTKALFLLFISAIALTSCNKEHAVAPVMTFDGKADHTIKELLELGTSDSLPAWTITGIVVSDDSYGNFYKTLIIQDKTGGININVGNNSLHTRYKIGQQVFVKCNGLVLGKSYGGSVLGIGAADDVESIPASAEFKYIYRHEVPQAEPAPFIITDLTPEDSIKAHLNQLVAIQGSKFKNADIGKTIVNGDAAYTSYEIDVNKCKLAINTSKYAHESIAKATVPMGTGTVYGVLSIYQTYGSPTYQITLRSINDLKFQWTEDVYSLNDHKYETLFGWSQNPNEENWKVANNEAFYIGKGVSTTSWLISPKFDLAKYNKVLVSFERKDQNNAMEVYYTTSEYAGSINSGSWTKIELDEYTGTQFVSETITVPGSTKHIAFRFNGDSEAKSYVRNINIKGIIQH
ncbi:MAG: DUF5689 domain-containing protein [Bacteroidales bacterium]|nr:DUF5689 domain-containing protein [Bacteroidales bacterium]